VCPDGDYAGLPEGILPGTVHIWEAQNGVVQAIVGAIQVQVVLHLVLAGAVGIQWVDGMVFVGGQILRFAVDGSAGGSIDYFATAVGASSLE